MREQYEEQRGVDGDATRVRATHDRSRPGPVLQRSSEEPDSTCEGIGVKSGMSKDTSQEVFDKGASYDKSAYATLHEESIKITSGAYEHVE